MSSPLRAKPNVLMQDAASGLTTHELHMLLRALPEVIAVYSPDLRYTYISPAVEAATGLPPEHFIGKTHREVGLPEDLCELFQVSLRQVFQTGKRAEIEFSYTRDVETRYYHGIAVAQVAPDGSVPTVLTVSRDVTDTKRAVQQLRRSEERFRLATAAGAVGIWDWDILHNIVSWSERLFDFHGLKPGEFGGTVEAFSRLVHPEDLQAVQGALAKALEQDAPYELEFRGLRSDGTYRYLTTRAQVLRDENGVPIRMLGATIDVTERRLAEDALRRSEKLAAAGRLAASISHEINNPLEAVTNLLYLLRSEPLTHEGKARLAMAELELGRASNLTKKSLAFYRDTNSRAPVHLCRIIAEVFDVYRIPALQNDVSLSMDCADDVLLQGYEGELRQILLNLVSNAVDATAAKGAVTVRAVRSDAAVHVEVRDTGSGIPAELLGKIWEPFFTTKKETGTGLGLWLTRELVTKNGGAIRVESHVEGPHRGTAFLLTFPDSD